MDFLKFLQSRTVVVGLIALLFALGNVFHVIPANLSQEKVVAAVLAATSALAIVFRAKAVLDVGSTFGYPETKPWWQSKTILTNLVAAVFAVLAVLNWVPEGLSQEQVVNTILGVVGIATVVFRATASKSIG